MGMMAVFFLFIIIPSAIFHEYAHGWMANQLGDPTAKYAGRLTLNPIVHIDKWGTLIMPLLLLVITQGSFMFAYAKPVPYNPYNLKSQKWGPAAVAAAGPISNLFLAFVFGQLMRYVPGGPLSMLLSVVVYANVLLAVFNLLPIPPLDGSKLLYAVLPDSMWKVKQILEQYGFFILLAFIMVGFSWIHPIINVIYLFLTGGNGLF
ncbi:MAG: site-2 protease family protein [Candidatus Magasanikbacteria bacterium]|jgi:Zn-dependent protease|nr:site-2 protease family protein [Candidatus Magasanikbacteria bacterium]MBT4314674.1 site-2 protease family protein [Candidatus Magasanikbacteria bacterium]MBT4547094.1 site-2 protease family protein [Candidatus Magasanikbacteria bacterium]